MNLKGKRIAFVGSCPNIKGLGQGELIESYDLVAKTNGSVYLDGDKYFTDYGKRIDILYTNHQFMREMWPFEIDIFRQRGIKFVRMKTCSGEQRRELKRNFDVDTITDSIHKVNRLVLYGALMGCYILQDLLDQGASTIYFTGIDFFQSKNKVFKHDDYREYLPGYLPDEIRIQGNRINAGKTEDGHNQLVNTGYIKRLFDAGKVEMPNVIRDIMLGICKGKLAQG